MDTIEWIDQSRPPLNADTLRTFSGTERHWQLMAPFQNPILYTDGVRYVASQGGAFWLLSEIALRQIIKAVKAEPFQVWILRVKPDKTATLSCEDGNGNVITKNDVMHTDFPLAEIKFYLTGGVLMLPSEY